MARFWETRWKKTRLRPSEGGKMWGPVGEDPDPPGTNDHPDVVYADLRENGRDYWGFVDGDGHDVVQDALCCEGCGYIKCSCITVLPDCTEAPRSWGWITEAEYLDLFKEKSRLLSAHLGTMAPYGAEWGTKPTQKKGWIKLKLSLDGERWDYRNFGFDQGLDVWDRRIQKMIGRLQRGQSWLDHSEPAPDVPYDFLAGSDWANLGGPSDPISDLENVIEFFKVDWTTLGIEDDEDE